jgi:hypothetical protein
MHSALYMSITKTTDLFGEIVSLLSVSMLLEELITVSNTTTISLWVVGGMKKVTHCLGYNWATPFPANIITGAWSSRLGEPRIWDSKISSWVPKDSDPRMTELKDGTNCKMQTLLLIIEGIPLEQIRNSQTVMKCWSLAQDGVLTPGHTGRLKVSRKKLCIREIDRQLGTENCRWMLPASDDRSLWRCKPRALHYWDPLPNSVVKAITQKLVSGNYL